MKQIIALLTVLCGTLAGQSIIAPASTVNGVPASNLITICSVNPGSGTCSSLVTTYTTFALSVACSGTGGPLSGTGCTNPGNSDAFGNIVAFATAGQYWCQYKQSTNAIAYSLPCSATGGTALGDNTLTGNLLFSPTATFDIGGTTGLLSPLKVFVGNGVASPFSGSILISPDTAAGATAMGVLTAQGNQLTVKAETPVSGSYEPGCQFLSSNGGVHGATICLIGQGFGGTSLTQDATASFLIAGVSSSTQTDSWLVNNQGINNEDHLNQGSWNDVTGAASQSNRTGGTCAMSAGTSCTFTLTRAFTATPICIATQQSATLTGGAVGCTVSGTTVTITSAVANSETWGALLIGNPN